MTVERSQAVNQEDQLLVLQPEVNEFTVRERVLVTAHQCGFNQTLALLVFAERTDLGRLMTSTVHDGFKPELTLLVLTSSANVVHAHTGDVDGNLGEAKPPFTDRLASEDFSHMKDAIHKPNWHQLHFLAPAR